MINWQIYSRGFNLDYDLYESKYNARGWNSASMIEAMKRSAYQNGYDGFEPDRESEAPSKPRSGRRILWTLVGADCDQGP